MVIRLSTQSLQMNWLNSDHSMVTWISLLLVGTTLSLVAACGGMRGSDQTGSGTVVDSSEPSTMASSSTSTTIAATTSTVAVSSTTDATASGIETDSTSAVELVELGLDAGIPIDPPEDFPALSDLDPSAFGFLHPTPYPRARISSRIELADEFAEQARQEGGLLSASYGFIITYYDSFTIWDYPDGLREVNAPDRGYLALTEDGSWEESDDFEDPVFGPIVDWSEIQEAAASLVQLDPLVVGYELLADIPTVHLRLQEVGPDVWADMWLDQKGAVIRAVLDIGGDLAGSNNQIWMVWDVQALDPKDIGPLPANS